MNKLYKAFQSITPNEFDNIKEKCRYRDEEVNVIMEAPRRKRNYKFVAAGLACMLALAVPFTLSKQNKVFATVGMDVNPSIEMNLDKEEKVIEVKAINEDGKKILGDMKLEGVDVEIAVDSIVDSMITNGYINELKNSLLVSVAGATNDENELLRKELTADINEILKEHKVDGSIVSQTLDDDDKIEQLAKKYNISKGKADLIEDIIEKNPKYTFESLKDLSINDLNILLRRNEVDKVNVNGEVSTGSYITQDKAKSIALNDAKVSDVKFQEVDLDYENGKMIYDVEFVKGETEYDYDLDATTGAILKKNKEAVDTNKDDADEKDDDKETPPANLISEAKVKDIALKHAKVSDVKNYQVKKDKEKSGWEYDVEFVSGTTKYEYSIDATNGKVLKVEKETVPVTKINADDARNKALSHAGLNANQVKCLEADLDKKGYYDVSFKADGYEYEYHVDGQSGQITHHLKEKE